MLLMERMKKNWEQWVGGYNIRKEEKTRKVAERRTAKY
jgi:hypothetical protein